jgi:hypothetical protein
MPSGSGRRALAIHTSWAVVAAPTLARAFASWCFTGRVRQAETVSGDLLRSGSNDGDDDDQLAVRGSPAETSPRPSPFSHASRLAAASHSSRPSIGIS